MRVSVKAASFGLCYGLRNRFSGYPTLWEHLLMDDWSALVY